jgi:hypothetical protein
MTKRRNNRISTLETQMKRQILGLLRNKKAVSVVVSTVVLTAGVIAASIAVLYWTYGMGKISHTEYNKSTNSSISALNERIGYEYISYSTGTLTVNIINCGRTDNLNVTRIYVMNNGYHDVANSGGASVILRTINDDGTSGTPIAGNHLDIGQDGSIRLNGLSLASGLYYVRITTGRGRNFDSSFGVP